MKISDIDKNFSASQGVSGGEFISIDSYPISVYGVKKDNEGYYRIPRESAKEISESVSYLNCQTTGGLFRFRTNSPTLTIKAENPVKIDFMPHMTELASGGFDAYSGKNFIASFPPASRGGYTLEKPLFTEKLEKDADGFFDVTVYMPLYGAYKDIYIKVSEGREIRQSKGFHNAKPVVFYGSSITQGACSASPGTSYINMLSRTLDLYCLNYGFSGSAKAEPALIELLARTEMSALVLDYDHNAPNAEHLERTHKVLFETVRKNNPSLPIVIASSIPVFINGRNADKRREIIYKTYDDAVKSGDKNVYFLNGYDFFDEIPFDICTVDGVHPNGLGMYCMFKGFESVIKNLNL